MIGAAEPFTRDTSVDVGEIVGTGGDKLKTINISTISGIICATLGLHVANTVIQLFHQNWSLRRTYTVRLQRKNFKRGYKKSS